jgi:hypothetical protein
VPPRPSAAGPVVKHQEAKLRGDARIFAPQQTQHRVPLALPRHLYRPRLLRHRVEGYAAMAAG